MGQKCNPKGLRLGIKQANGKRRESSIIQFGSNYAELLSQNLEIIKTIKSKTKKLSPSITASISNIVIKRMSSKVEVTIHSAKPGMLIGKKGSDIDMIKKELAKFVKDDIHLNIVEVRKPEIDANIVAQSIAFQVEKRVSYKRAMKAAIQQAMKYGALGVKVMVSGRLGGAEIARSEWDRQGRVPLHTFKADIDYALAEANTTYGVIGVKVWIYRPDNI